MIGFIGLDTEGEIMCLNTMKQCGRNIMVYDNNKEQMEKLYNKGAVKAESIKELGEICNIIITILPNVDQVKTVYEELLTVLHEDQILIDMSSISSEISKEIELKVKGKSANMIDAAIVQVDNNDIPAYAIYVGGDMAIFEKVKSILSCMGQNVIHVGPNGTGIMMKVCHGVFIKQIQNIINEAILLATKANIDISKFVTSKVYGNTDAIYQNLSGNRTENSSFTTIFSIENIYKDIQLAEELAKYLGADIKGIEFIKEMYNKVITGNICEEDITSAIKYVDTQ